VKILFKLFCFLFFFIAINLPIQVCGEVVNIPPDSTQKVKSPLLLSATKVQKNDSIKKMNLVDPVKVVWMGSVFPGYGQILNKKYWKVPLVYGGFAACAYFISWNTSKYQKYTTAYRDIIDTDDNTNSFIAALPTGYTVETFGGKDYYIQTLKTAQDNYRRNRDLSILCSVGFYALTIVDAFVDAQLSDFDISPDLSLHLQPVLFQSFPNQYTTLGLKCNFNF